MVRPREIPVSPRPSALIYPPHDGNADFLLPDSEAVYGPAYANFDVKAYVQQRGGRLTTYREMVEGDELTGAQIVQLVAERMSVGPRVLLTLLELEGGWVTSSAPGTVLNLVNANPFDSSGLYTQLYMAGTYINAGYYGKLSNQIQVMVMPDGNGVRVPGGLNPGTAAVQNLLAHHTTYANWLRLVAPDGFRQTYQRLFGDPAQYALQAAPPSDPAQPALRLPWPDGQLWFYTGGPHAGWGDGSPRAAIDFGPPSADGCFTAPEWAIAAASGRVDASEHGRVVLNLAGNAFQGIGWSLVYMHMANEGRVTQGATLLSGDRIGHPSCEGGVSTGSHLHFARLYNGQWVSADGSQPLDLSGWLFKNLPEEYDGTAFRLGGTREAGIDHVDELNGLSGEPARAMPTTTPEPKLHGDTIGIQRQPTSGR